MEKIFSIKLVWKSLSLRRYGNIIEGIICINDDVEVANGSTSELT
ncbi:hypothetical protein [Clostridium butyricum]